MAINYLGHFMLTHLLIPNLRAGAEAIGIKSRVVSTASNVHEVGLINYSDFNCKKYYRASMAYANSKLAQIMFTYELERVCRKENWDIQSFAPHPGENCLFVDLSISLCPLKNLTVVVYMLHRKTQKTPQKIFIFCDILNNCFLHLKSTGVVDTDIFQKSLVNHIPGWKRFLFKVSLSSLICLSVCTLYLKRHNIVARPLPY